MAVTKPRNRLVNFRVSDDEFENLKEASLSGGARSISDFARTAVLNTFGRPSQLEGVLRLRLSDLDEKMDVLESSLRSLLERLDTDSAPLSRVQNSEISVAQH